MSQTSTSTWERTKGYSKRGFDKAWHQLDRIGRPVNRLSNKLGAEAFWPTTLDLESEKAARILRSFCTDGFYSQPESDNGGGGSGSNTSLQTQQTQQTKPAETRASPQRSRFSWRFSLQPLQPQSPKLPQQQQQQQQPPPTPPPQPEEHGPRGKQQRAIKKIPASVIRQAKGLAIFTTMRTGLWVSGAGGSGVLVARLAETGEWSPPSGIMLHTAGLGFLVGVDIYDCVVVINTYEALEAFKSIRCTLGGSLSAVAGPVGVGGVLDSEVHKRQAPIWSYLKSRGLYAGVQVDGTIVIERSDENERFYGEKISAADILSGKAKDPPSSISTLIQTIKAAQGDQDIDEDMLPPSGEAPGDAEISLAGTFGVPEEDDPDPYGVKALEREGVMIREAGTKRTPTLDVFDFRPSPTSPISPRWSNRSSWRSSTQSAMSTDKGTQTNLHELNRGRSPSTASRTSSRSHSIKDLSSSIHEHTSDTEHSSTGEPDPASIPIPASTTTSRAQSISSKVPEAIPESLPESLPETEIAVAVAEQAIPQRINSKSSPFARAKLVTIPKRNPPALPARNPSRAPSTVATLSEARESGLLALSLDSDAGTPQLLAREYSNESDASEGVTKRRGSSISLHSHNISRRTSTSPKSTSPLSKSVFLASEPDPLPEADLTVSEPVSPTNAGPETKEEPKEEEPKKKESDETVVEAPPLTTGAFPSDEKI
ncbi:LAS seventeen-binding protein 3 [Nannizzia gypsea CBS 118893]|uniref:LAS seventeen-binding protein 3 n=1 Tax=Arthroderma gypseum (strain ATCC MYA-4604 / CBS 118893) TaxID=535722 RepID=E4UTA6_ARTGP|nr:LAS seventeen-binding protein 3 [Nannizzia gypsea CBS 118893]EFR00667.1 LAS seventeen-binding protein 3 [Nannizzia gypsea CBS 118893]